MNRPRYVLLAVVDEPIGNKGTYNYATGGWVAAPIVGKMVSRMAPILGIAPTVDNDMEVTTLPVRNIGPNSQNQKSKRTFQAIYKPDAQRWAKNIADAVGITLSNQTEAEEKLILRTRKALTRAVTARAERRKLLSMAVSLVERGGASH